MGAMLAFGLLLSRQSVTRHLLHLLLRKNCDCSCTSDLIGCFFISEPAEQ